MKEIGMLRKMATRNPSRVQYDLPIGDKTILMNDLIGQELEFSFQNEIRCIECGKITKRSFAQGFCYMCFLNSPRNSECIIRPELCRAHLGKGRDAEWERENHLQDHYVYLALSSVVKVGVTRATEVPYRWIDQGAWKAIKLARTPNRYLAGLIEVSLKQHMTDRTNWRKMLKNEVNESINLVTEKQRAACLLSREMKQYLIDDDEVLMISYPVLAYPEKVTSLTLDKNPRIRGKLMGIKGQYLILNSNRVINIRRHTGYIVEFSW